MPSAASQKSVLDASHNGPLPQPPIVTIQTERLILTTLTMSDLDGVMPIIQNPDVMKWTSRPPVKTKSEGATWLSTRCLGRDVFNFAIRLRFPSPSPSTAAPAESESKPGSTAAEGELIGLIGSFHWPSVGYMVHPAYAGHGYATEALRAFVPAYFARVPAARTTTSGAEPGAPETEAEAEARAEAGGFDVLEGFADTENGASHRVLEKAGFTRGETTVGDFENEMMGRRDTVAFRCARPGRTLAELGFGGAREREEAPVPPVQ